MFLPLGVTLKMPVLSSNLLYSGFVLQVVLHILSCPYCA
jgi:hypothetical protein